MLMRKKSRVNPATNKGRGTEKERAGKEVKKKIGAFCRSVTLRGGAWGRQVAETTGVLFIVQWLEEHTTCATHIEQ